MSNRHISYECSELIKELNEDISEFGGDKQVIVFCKDIDGATIYTNYDFIVEDMPFDDSELAEGEHVQVMTMTSLLILFEEQNKII